MLRAVSFGVDCGAIAQLVERFHGMEEVKGSIPFSSTPVLVATGIRPKAADDGWSLTGRFAHRRSLGMLSPPNRPMTSLGRTKAKPGRPELVMHAPRS